MNITQVKVKVLRREDSKFRAVASITIDDDFVVHDLKLIEGQDGLFIVMPSKKTPDGQYRDVAHPLRTEIREQIKNAVIEEYEKELAAQAE